MPGVLGLHRHFDENFQVWCEENGERGKKLLEEYVDTDRGPTDVTHGSSYKALWKCATCEHEWRATMNHHTRANNPAGCPSCSRYAARSTFRVWCDANGERGKKLLEEYVDTDRGPTDVTHGSNYKALWKCATCEHEWRAKMNNRMRANNPSGCPACSGYTATSTKNFQVWCEENGERGKKLLEEYVDTDRGPTDVTHGSSYKALWKCATCEHEWRATMNHRTRANNPSRVPGVLGLRRQVDEKLPGVVRRERRAREEAPRGVRRYGQRTDGRDASVGVQGAVEVCDVRARVAGEGGQPHEQSQTLRVPEVRESYAAEQDEQLPGVVRRQRRAREDTPRGVHRSGQGTYARDEWVDVQGAVEVCDVRARVADDAELSHAERQTHRLPGELPQEA